MTNKRETGTDPESGAEGRYDEELLSANWNPVIDLLAWSCGKSAEQARREHAEAMSDSDIDGFLNRIYTLGAS